MHKIVLISCFLGKFPNYFPYFIKSCELNSDIDFLIFTDNSDLPFEIPTNVFLIDFNLEKFCKLASLNLKLKVVFHNAYKMCDFKPAYGTIFGDYISKYDFWGHIDIDIIFGNIRTHISSFLLNNFDVISVRKEYISGFFCLYRNIPKINNIYLKSSDYQLIFESTKHFCFDECNFAYDRLFNGESILDFDTEQQSMTYIVLKCHSEGYLNAHFETLAEEFNPNLIWYNGVLTYTNTGESILLFHLINFKNIQSFITMKILNKHIILISKFGLSSNYLQYFFQKKVSILLLILFNLKFSYNKYISSFIFKGPFLSDIYIGSYMYSNSNFEIDIYFHEKFVFARKPTGDSIELIPIGNDFFVTTDIIDGKISYLYVRFELVNSIRQIKIKHFYGSMLFLNVLD